MRKRYLWLILLLLAGCAPAVFAQREEASCSIEGWVTDKDPKGLNVRSQPNASSKVIAKLKAPGGDDAIIVTITGYANGWLKIARAQTLGGEVQLEDIGWVSAKLVATGAKGEDGDYNKPAPLYAQAKASGKKIGSVPSGESVTISGFSCGWLKVTYQGKTGWLRAGNICGNPATDCS